MNILTTTQNGHDSVSDLKALIETSLDDDKALNIETIDISSQTAIADYLVIASGTSSTQVKALAEKLKDRLNGRDYKNIRTEGSEQGDWVIVDAGDIIVHLFKPEIREFYNIKKMWSMDFSKSPTDTIYSA